MKTSKNKKTTIKKILVSYVVTTLVCLAVDVFFCLTVPKKFASQVLISDEPKETGLLVGLNRMSAWVSQGSLQADKKGMDIPEVYPKMLLSEEFLKEILMTKLDTPHLTLHEYLANEVSKDEDLYEILSKKIEYSIRPFVHTITIQYTDADPKVAYTVLNSIVNQLYKRLNERKISLNAYNLENAKDKREKARLKYINLQKEYTRLYDSEENASIPKLRIQISQLEKERDDAFAAYEQACEEEMRYEYLSQKTSSPFSIIRKSYIATQPIFPKPIPYFFAILLLGLLTNTWIILYILKRSRT